MKAQPDHYCTEAALREREQEIFATSHNLYRPHALYGMITLSEVELEQCRVCWPTAVVANGSFTLCLSVAISE